MNACRFCPMCYPVDAVALKTKRMSCSPRGRSLILSLLEQGKLEWNMDVADILYKFSPDGLCREWCVGKYDLDQLIMDSRHQLIQKEIIPEEVSKVISNVTKYGNPFGDEPGSLKKILAEAGSIPSSNPNLLLFLGCTARIKTPTLIKYFIQLLNRVNIPFAIMDEEICCGGILYELGDYKKAKEQASILKATFSKKNTNNVCVLDPECYRMFLTRYPRWNINLDKGTQIFNAGEYIWSLLESKYIKVNRLISEKVVYHDPFQFARYAVDFESARKILNKLCATKIEEMRFNKSLAHCCGSAGGLFFTNPDIALEMAKDIIEEAMETGASLLVTNSPFCQFLLQKAKEDYLVKDIQIKHIIELTLESIQ